MGGRFGAGCGLGVNAGRHPGPKADGEVRGEKEPSGWGKGNKSCPPQSNPHPSSRSAHLSRLDLGRVRKWRTLGELEEAPRF